MKKYFVTVIFICLFTGILSAQSNYELKQAIDLVRTNKLLNGDYKSVLTESDIKGSPYLENDFIKGSIYTKSKTKYVDVPLRYNIYNDQMEFKLGENKIQALAAPETIKEVEFGKYNMEYIPYSDAKKIQWGFFLMLEEGKASLYAKPQVIFKEATEPAAYQDAKPAEFIRKPDEYYIKVDVSQAKHVGNKKDLLEIFPDHKKQIEAFIKKHKVKPSKPETLKELVQYYNSL